MRFILLDDGVFALVISLRRINLSEKEDVRAEDRLTEDLALDSLNRVLLLVSLEEELGIELDESDMNPFDLITVADVCALVCKYKGEET